MPDESCRKCGGEIDTLNCSKCKMPIERICKCCKHAIRLISHYCIRNITTIPYACVANA